MVGSQHPSPEQLKAFFQSLLHRIQGATDRRQLEEATCGALQLMLRRSGDRELLGSLSHQARGVIQSLPEIVQDDNAKAELRRASGLCIELLKQAKRMRKPRPPSDW